MPPVFWRGEIDPTRTSAGSFSCVLCSLRIVYIYDDACIYIYIYTYVYMDIADQRHRLAGVSLGAGDRGAFARSLAEALRGAPAVAERSRKICAADVACGGPSRFTCPQ